MGLPLLNFLSFKGSIDTTHRNSNMKKLGLLLVATILTIGGAFAQIHDPVKWSVASKKLNAKEGVIFIKATIDKGWNIYGMNVPDGGPIPTSFKYTPAKGVTLNGKTAAPAPKSKHDANFGMDIPYYTEVVTFQQKVKLVNGQATVKGEVEFMACDDERCLPPDVYEFTVTIK